MSKKILEEQGKFNFARKGFAIYKTPANISAKTLILCELLRLYFKHKNNNIKRKIFRVEQIFIKRHSKGEFHVSVKGLKLWSLVPLQVVSYDSWELAKPSGCGSTKNSLRRETTGTRERLYVTLRYFASGDLRSLTAASYKIIPVTVSLFINIAYLEKWNVPLHQSYRAPPETSDVWKSYRRWILNLEFPKLFCIWKAYCHGGSYKIWLFVFQLQGQT